MRIPRSQIIAAMLLLLVALSAASRAQIQTSPGHEERAKAINLVRAINTAEVSYSMDPKNGHRRFASWGELCNSGLVKTTLQVSPDPEVIPGYHLNLLVSTDGQSFLLALHDTREGEDLFSVFSDESGIIYLGAPLQ